MPRCRFVTWGVLGMVLLGAPVSGQDSPASRVDDGVDRPAASAPGGSGAGPAQAPEPAPLVAADDKPFARFFPNLVSDLRRFPSTSTAVVLGIGGLASGASLPADDYVSEHASAGGRNQFFHPGSIIGDGYVQAGSAVAVYALGRLTHAPRVSHLGADLIRTQALNGLLTYSAKLLVRRARPGRSPGHQSFSSSFPSGHSSATWSAATVIWRHFGWKAGAPAGAVATYVAASRVQEKQHYLSDVAFGTALGIAAGRTVTWQHGGRRIVAGPAFVPGGLAVALTVERR